MIVYELCGNKWIHTTNFLAVIRSLKMCLLEKQIVIYSFNVFYEIDITSLFGCNEMCLTHSPDVFMVPQFLHIHKHQSVAYHLTHHLSYLFPQNAFWRMINGQQEIRLCLLGFDYSLIVTDSYRSLHTVADRCTPHFFHLFLE